VLEIYDCSSVVVRRVVARDCRPSSYGDVIGILGSTNVLLEDCAAYGAANAMVWVGSSRGIVVRRLWAEMQGPLDGSSMGSVLWLDQSDPPHDVILENVFLSLGPGDPGWPTRDLFSFSPYSTNLSLLGSAAYLQPSSTGLLHNMIYTYGDLSDISIRLENVALVDKRLAAASLSFAFVDAFNGTNVSARLSMSNITVIGTTGTRPRRLEMLLLDRVYIHSHGHVCRHLGRDGGVVIESGAVHSKWIWCQLVQSIQQRYPPPF